MRADDPPYTTRPRRDTQLRTRLLLTEGPVGTMNLGDHISMCLRSHSTVTIGFIRDSKWVCCSSGQLESAQNERSGPSIQVVSGPIFWACAPASSAASLSAPVSEFPRRIRPRSRRTAHRCGNPRLRPTPMPPRPSCSTPPQQHGSGRTRSRAAAAKASATTRGALRSARGSGRCAPLPHALRTASARLDRAIAPEQEPPSRRSPATHRTWLHLSSAP